MVDLQTVIFVDTINSSISKISPIFMLKVVGAATPDEAVVDGVVARTMTDGRALYISLPAGRRYVDVGELVLRYGGDAPDVVYSAAAGDFAPITAPDDAAFPVTAYAKSLYIAGPRFSDILAVRINNMHMPFTLISETELVVQTPEVRRIQQIDVLCRSKSVSPESTLLHMLGASVSTVSGKQKLVSQLLACLLTTSGTDHFDRTAPAGNLQSWHTQVVSASNAQAFAAKLTLEVTRCSAEFALRQMLLPIPDSEKLAYAEVVNIGASPTKPGSMSLELRIVTRDGISQSIGALVNTAQTMVTDAVADR